MQYWIILLIPEIQLIMRNLIYQNSFYFGHIQRLSDRYDFSINPIPYKHNIDMPCQTVHVLLYCELVLNKIHHRINAYQEYYLIIIEKKKREGQQTEVNYSVHQETLKAKGIMMIRRFFFKDVFLLWRHLQQEFVFHYLKYSQSCP
jgi:hypothetical protein